MEYVKVEKGLFEYYQLRLKDDVFFVSTLYIQGMEVTQAIQYYRSDQHLTDPADQMPDNSVTLIAGKPAWVRVYVRSGKLYGDIPNVTGTLEVSRRSLGFFYLPIATLNPEPPGTVTAMSDPLYATERGTLGYTLNFIIPAEQMCGNLKLTATITSPIGQTDSETIYINVTLQQTLQVRGIMVGYNGPVSLAPGAANLALAAPGLADLQSTAAWTLLIYPVQSQASFGSAGSITWNLPLTDPPSCNGCCSPNWVALNAAVQAQKIADGNRTDVLYYGLMASGIPMGPIIGCNSAGVSSGTNADQVTMAHELGHACGLPHAPCGVGGDPAYPAYEPYDPAGTPQASIGEYGLDISTGTIKPPDTFKDWMSYCSPDWISLYNHGNLVNNFNLHPERVCVDHPWILDHMVIEEVFPPFPWPLERLKIPWREYIVYIPEPVISIIGIVHAEDEIEVTSVMRLDAVSQIPQGVDTDLIAELVGNNKEVLSRAPLVRLPSHGCCTEGCSEGKTPGSTYPYTFQIMLSDVKPGSAIRIRRGDQDIWVRKAPVEKPQIENFNLMLEQDRLVFNYKTQQPSEKLETWLQWSDDEGKTWRGLATDLRGKKAISGITGLPGGRLLFRLLVSDGFNTSISKPIQIEIPAPPPVVSILSPRKGQILPAGGTMRLWGMVSLGGSTVNKVDKATWLLDGKRIGEGLDIYVPTPPQGKHKLVLTVSSAKLLTKVSTEFATVEFNTQGK